MADVGVRAAGADDVPEIARIQVLTWTTAYRPFLPEAVLAGLTEERAAGAWAAAVGAPPPYRVLVAYEQDWTVGFAAIGPSGEEDASPGDAAVAVLLVEPRWGRRGHGSRLLAAAVDHLRADGLTRLVAWVPEGDGPRPPSTPRPAGSGTGWSAPWRRTPAPCGRPAGTCRSRRAPREVRRASRSGR